MEGFPLFPERASTLAGEVDALTFAWLGISLFFSVLIAVLVIYFFVRFRQVKSGDIGRPERASYPLEITWTAIPLAIALTMFAWGMKVFFSLSRPPADAVEFFVTAKQWMWKIQHPSGAREINDLHVPMGVPIKLTMTSEDVIHSFFVPAFRIKQDVLPGRYTTVWFEATKPGRYHLFCTEYCGAEHSQMGGWVYVLPADAYEAWLGGGPPAKPPVELGADLFTAKACDTCHKTGGRGPLLDDLYGREVQLVTGRTVVADEDYLRESILDPGARVVAGYEVLMPTYQGQLTEEQLGYLVTYVKSLSTAPATEPRAAAPGAAASAAAAASTGAR